MRNRTWQLPEAIYQASAFIYANLLWLVLSLPLITLPAATAALFAALVPGNEDSVGLFSFLRAMRRFGLKGTLLGLLDAGFAAIIVVNLVTLRQMSGGPLPSLALTLTVVLTLLIVMINVYAWPLLVVHDPPARALLVNAVKLSLVHPLWGLTIGLLAFIPIGLSLLLPRIYLFLAGAASAVYITHWGVERILRRYDNES